MASKRSKNKENSEKKGEQNIKYTIDVMIEINERMISKLQESYDDPKKYTGRTELLMEEKICFSSYYENMRHYSSKEYKESYPENIEKSKQLKSLEDKLNNLLQQKLIKCGLLGQYNTTMAIFVAKNWYGMKDKQEIEHNGNTFEIKVITEK